MYNTYDGYYVSLLKIPEQPKTLVLHAFLFCSMFLFSNTDRQGLYDGWAVRRKDILSVQCPVPEPWLWGLTSADTAARWRSPGGLRASGGQNIPQGSQEILGYCFSPPIQKIQCLPTPLQWAPRRTSVLQHLPIPVPLYGDFMSMSATAFFSYMFSLKALEEEYRHSWR